MFDCRKPRSRKRKAAAIVEFAICLPVLILIILGSIEACNYIFLKQALTEAAYQGALVAIKPDATEPLIRSRIQTILDARDITSTNIDVANNGFSFLSRGDQFSISVDAQTSTNRISPTIISTLNNISATCTAIKQ